MCLVVRGWAFDSRSVSVCVLSTETAGTGHHVIQGTSGGYQCPSAHGVWFSLASGRLRVRALHPRFVLPYEVALTHDVEVRVAETGVDHRAIPDHNVQPFRPSKQNS